MKSTAIILRSDLDAQRAVSLINNLPHDGKVQIVIGNATQKRSTAQKGLYFLWAGVLAGELGNDKESQHLDLKRRFLLPIYEQSDEGFAEMIDSVRDVWKSGQRLKAERLLLKVASLASTNDATVEQMTQYLTDVEHWAISTGIILPKPEDQYYEALRRAA